MAGRSGRVNRREAALAALIEAPNLRAAAQVDDRICLPTAL